MNRDGPREPAACRPGLRTILPLSSSPLMQTPTLGEARYPSPIGHKVSDGIRIAERRPE